PLLAVLTRLHRLNISRFDINAGRLLFRPLQRQFGGRLRYAVSGGPGLPREAARAAMALGIPIMQGYGLSEASPVVATQRFHHRRFWWSRDFWLRAGSVGGPMPRVTVSIQPVEGIEGDLGEIVVEGPNVMLG